MQSVGLLGLGMMGSGMIGRFADDRTSQSQAATSNANGAFSIPSVAPGNYHLQCAAKGFSSSTGEAVLQTNQTLNGPIKLSVAGSVQTVNVSTQSPLLNAAESRIEESIDYLGANSRRLLSGEALHTS